MKRNAAFPSNYLSQVDVTTPIRATIADVHPVTLKGDDGDEKKVAMVFTDQRIKPMVLNNTNWMVCEEAYGDDSDFWKAKHVEIYVDPNVMFGKKKVGGLRLRVPSGDASPTTNGAAMTFQEAIDECGKVGVSREALIGHLKAAGRAGWQGSRDTSLVHDIIRRAKMDQPEQGFDEPAVTGNDDIPF